MSFPEQQPGGAEEQSQFKGAPDSEELIHPVEDMSLPGGGVQESAACSQPREEQTDEPKKPER